ncbi:c-type cytochrome [Ralstonia sp.]|uniref:c-type cytochrome n=1 Tax=Ralstonia sp. TaxID=54061 RepID=UPI0031D14FD3
MKKLILAGVGAVVAVLLVIFGQDLIDLYRLDRYVAASAEAYQADGGPWPHVTDGCFACHGAKGNSLHQGYPSLAGQPAAYLQTQLHNFASGARSSPNMGPLAMTMGDAQIKGLAEYFSKATPVANRYFKPDPQLRGKGQQLVVTGNCAACHGTQLMGHNQFPRLAGQGADYLLAQLDAFATGKRSESTGAMKAIAAALSPDERKAVAHYLASLAPQKI